MKMTDPLPVRLISIMLPSFQFDSCVDILTYSKHTSAEPKTEESLCLVSPISGGSVRGVSCRQ